MSLERARVLVVGGSAGIGREVGIAAARGGAVVAFAARRADRLDDAVAAAGSGCAVTLDVTDRTSVEAGVATAVQALGGLDAVVYASGVASISPLRDETEDNWRRMFDTNVVGAASVASAVIEHLEDRGVMLFMSSTNTYRRLWGLSVYGATKAALDRLVDGLADEHPGVRFVRAVLGPTTGTEFGERFDMPTLTEAMDRWVGARQHPATMMDAPTAGDVLARFLAVLHEFPGVGIPVVHLDPSGGPT